MGKRRSKANRPRGYGEPENGPSRVTRLHEVEEFAEGSIGSSLRYRNVGEHPLTLAYARGKLGCDGIHHPRPKSDCNGCARFRAGEEYRTQYEAMLSSGKDSTQPRISGAQRPELSDRQEMAGLNVARIERALSRKNKIIVESFCGKGDSARGALTAAHIPFGNDSVLARLCEALDELVEAVGTKQRHRAA